MKRRTFIQVASGLAAVLPLLKFLEKPKPTDIKIEEPPECVATSTWTTNENTAFIFNEEMNSTNKVDVYFRGVKVHYVKNLSGHH